MSIGNCSVTERRRWRPPYQTGKTVHVHANTLQTRRGRTLGAGCARPWLRTAEPHGELRYENWITHTQTHTDTHTYTHTHVKARGVTETTLKSFSTFIYIKQKHDDMTNN